MRKTILTTAISATLLGTFAMGAHAQNEPQGMYSADDILDAEVYFAGGSCELDFPGFASPFLLCSGNLLSFRMRFLELLPIGFGSLFLQLQPLSHVRVLRRGGGVLREARLQPVAL